MANTLTKETTSGGIKCYEFNCSSAAGATENLQLPINARVRGISQPVFTSATARTATGYQYTPSTGVLVISGLTAADVFDVTVFTD